MAPVSAPSNIAAFVRWKESSIYAGEDIECIITFKNVARVSAKEGERDTQQARVHNGLSGRQSRTASIAGSRRSSIAHSVAPSMQTRPVTVSRQASQFRGHRPALSLNVVGGLSRGDPQSAPAVATVPSSAVQKHGRSLSIMSLASDRTIDAQVSSTAVSAKRPLKMHGRSASVASIPSTRASSGPYASPAIPRQPSPLYESSTPPALGEGQTEQLPIRSIKRRPGTVSASTTPQLAQRNDTQRSPSNSNSDQNFRFPIPQPKAKASNPNKPSREPSTLHSAQKRPISPRPPESWSGALSSLDPISRVVSESTADDASRSSGEFYTMSNHSDETVMSDLPAQIQPNGRLYPRPSLSRQPSKSRPSLRKTGPEMLMMGYAQTMGYFTLDGSLVNAAPFEEIKRKGVQGGGGVIGIDQAKNTSGMFGAMGWSNMGESRGGLLGGDEKSSIAQMKAAAGSKSIPLLSTPQNLLFVDLTLAPGESKSFAYRFPLPRGLPPSHKGRAIKVAYHIALGVQRPEGQIVKQIELPFRVLGSYNAHGEIRGHDLMSPYILVKDAAKSKAVSPGPSSAFDFTNLSPKESTKPTPKQGLEDFLRYTERLLEQSKDTSTPLASPTAPMSPRSISRAHSFADQSPHSIKEIIDLAIMRANQLPPAGKHPESERQSANRFNITRAGQPVAVLTILRPAYRLGKAVIGTIDFTASPSGESNSLPHLPTYSVLAELESEEHVDPSLALRSTNSIHRVTRRVHSSTFENTLYARRIGLHLTIPSTATPTFETTGVSLSWRLKVEFTVQRQAQGLGPEDPAYQEDSELMEELGRDERGITLIAKEGLVADSFEIGVPLRIYGSPGTDAAGGEGEALWF